MDELLKFIAQSMVDHPEAVEVTVNEKETATVLQLHVAESDMGKVIGKQGKIAKAMRTIVRAATPASSKRYAIEIRERGGETVDHRDRRGQGQLLRRRYRHLHH